MEEESDVFSLGILDFQSYLSLSLAPSDLEEMTFQRCKNIASFCDLKPFSGSSLCENQFHCPQRVLQGPAARPAPVSPARLPTRSPRGTAAQSLPAALQLLPSSHQGLRAASSFTGSSRLPWSLQNCPVLLLHFSASMSPFGEHAFPDHLP